MSVFVDSIRRDNDDEDLNTRLKIYSEFFSSGSKGNIDLVLVCEDKKHMAEVYKTILLNNIDIPNLYFTYDLMLLEEDIATTLFKFTIKNKDLDLENVKNDIWKNR